MIAWLRYVVLWPIRTVWVVARYLRKALVPAAFAGLVVLNIATLISEQVFDVLSRAISQVTDMPTVAKRHAAVRGDLRRARSRLERNELQLRAGRHHLTRVRLERDAAYLARNDLATRLEQQQSRTRQVATRVRNRVGVKAVSNGATVLMEPVPLIGVGVIVVEMAAELALACDTMKSMDELLSGLGDAAGDEETAKVCGMETPDVGELVESARNWTYETWSLTVNSLHGSMPKLPDFTLPELPAVDPVEWFDAFLASWGRE